MDVYYSPEEQLYIDAQRQEPEVQKWLSRFAAEDVPVFLARYHRQRTQWLNVGSYHLKQKHEWLTIDIERAESVLFYIQQKKLFDLQCLWRAEQADVPGVEHSGDFYDLEDDIRSQGMLAPITEDELELLKKYLTDYRVSQRLYPVDGWQKYRRYIKNNQESIFGSLPELYNYMDFQTGTTSLWKVLPDIRGEKEGRYVFASMDTRKQAAMSQAAATPPPRSFYVTETMVNDFAAAFEDHNTNECRVAYEEVSLYNEDHELKFAIESLQHAQEPVAMEPHGDWRAAIIYAAWKYERKRLLPSLDTAYENYLFRLQMGIGFARAKEKSSREREVSEQDGWRRMILDGREALGEPRNFDF